MERLVRIAYERASQIIGRKKREKEVRERSDDATANEKH
jgi:hypothetical protein